MYRARAQGLLVVVVLVIAGCSQSDRWKDARPETALASGVVTYEGEPLEGAIVVFQPTALGGVGASALTDETGKFELKTYPPDLGAVPGKYSVTILKTEMPDQAESDDPAPVQAVSLIPVKYSNPVESKLIAEIPEDGTDTLDFSLKK